MNSLKSIHRETTACTACPRLRRYCQGVAATKRKAYQNEDYWGKPISGFGDPKARLILVGLAPAAHGANRTGRIFTGDRSGDWLYRAMHKEGFANQPTSLHARDGLKLHDAYVTCVVKCAPPDNKPSRAEIARCSDFLERELRALSHARVYVALGQIGLAGVWPFLAPGLARPKLKHGESVELPEGRGTLIFSYHPSQQNTFTGRLTEPMFDRIFALARGMLD